MKQIILTFRALAYVALQHTKGSITTLGTIGGAVAILAVLAGCAAMQPKSPEQIVTERAKARWEALLAGKVAEAYPLYSPGYRSAVSQRALGHRLATQRVRWTSAEFREISCETEVCEAVFEVGYAYRVPIQGVGTVRRTSTVSESWVRSDGEWFYVPPDLEKSGLR